MLHWLHVLDSCGYSLHRLIFRSSSIFIFKLSRRIHDVHEDVMINCQAFSLKLESRCDGESVPNVTLSIEA